MVNFVCPNVRPLEKLYWANLTKIALRDDSDCVTNLWSGLGLPFFLMLFAVVSLKCKRPNVTLVILSPGKFTLKEMEKNKTKNQDKIHIINSFSFSTCIVLSILILTWPAEKAFCCDLTETARWWWNDSVLQATKWVKASKKHLHSDHKCFHKVFSAMLSLPWPQTPSHGSSPRAWDLLGFWQIWDLQPSLCEPSPGSGSSSGRQRLHQLWSSWSPYQCLHGNLEVVYTKKGYKMSTNNKVMIARASVQFFCEYCDLHFRHSIVNIVCICQRKIVVNKATVELLCVSE